MAFDYGVRRTGIAVTDPGRIIATGLAGVDTSRLFDFIASYLARESVTLFLVGLPLDNNGRDTHSTPAVRRFLAELRKRWPGIAIETADERYTSKEAMHALVQSGVKKKARRDKHLLDEVSATLILQTYLEQTSS